LAPVAPPCGYSSPIGHLLGKSRSKQKAKYGFVERKKRFQLCFVTIKPRFTPREYANDPANAGYIQYSTHPG
jgi:hypothetical protein